MTLFTVSPFDPDWRSRAACQGYSWRMFFPPEKDHDEAGHASPERAALTPQVQRLCDGCPVRLDCLQEALLHADRGIWGGTTYEQRRKLLRRVADRKLCPCCDSRDIQQAGESGVCLSCGISWRSRIITASPRPDRRSPKATPPASATPAVPPS